MNSTTDDSLLHNYLALRTRIDAHAASVEQRHPDQIQCRKGCDSCCRHLSLLPVEAAVIRQAVLAAPLTVRQALKQALSSHGDACPLLVENACLLYAVRPLICRTHGLPLLIQEEQGERIDFCPLNFQQTEQLKGADVLSLETVNQALIAINQLYLEQSGEDDQRRPLSEILKLALQAADQEMDLEATGGPQAEPPDSD